MSSFPFIPLPQLIGFDGPIFDIELIHLLDTLPEGVNFTVLVDGCYRLLFLLSFFFFIPFFLPCSMLFGILFFIFFSQTINREERTLFQDAVRGFFLVSHATDPKVKEMPYTAGGAMTNSLVTVMKENNNSVPLENLKEAVASLLKTLNLYLFSSPLDNSTGKVESSLF